MATTRILDPHDPRLDGFLHASVGEDRNGNMVTVLSTLSRLGLEPWDTASNLADMTRAAAGARLEELLARFRDVPTPLPDRGRIARKLAGLLPERPMRLSGPRGAVSSTGVISATLIWTILAILLLAGQLMMSGMPRAGQ